MKKQKVFWFHYNKPMSTKYGRPKITIHYNGICHIANNIVCNVPTFGHLKKDQPKFVIKGKCNSFEIVDEIAYVK